MLGTSSSRKKGDFGLLGEIGKKFGYKIQAEWMKIDQVWYYYLPKPQGWMQTPWKTDVVIEHENDPSNIEYVINKLIEVCAPLKICFFYPGEEDEDDALYRISEIIKN